MNCPRCETVVLVELDRDAVTIDRCARCRGVWLDRGELEKLLARAQRDDDTAARARAADDSDDRPRGWRDERTARRHDDDDDDHHRHPGRRRSWWEIFD